MVGVVTLHQTSFASSLTNGMPMDLRYTVTTGLLLLTFGCSTTSTIARVNGPPIEGNIVGGSPETIFVRSDDDREFEVKRDDISSIDYPGNVHAAIGGGVLGYGALNIAVGMPKCSEQTDGKAAYCTGVFLPAAIGLGMIIWGLVVHHGQVAAAEDTSRESLLENPPPVPTRPRTLARPPAPAEETKPLPVNLDEDETPAAPPTNPPAARTPGPAATATTAPRAMPPASTPAPSAPPSSTASFPPEDAPAPSPPAKTKR